MVLSTNKFWAECICVNQDDTDERSAQLRLMPEICKTAENTRIWLGDEDDKRADEIVNKMAEIGQALMETVGEKWSEYENLHEIYEDLTRKSVARTRQGRPQPFTYDWSDFNELLSRSWWRRRQSIEETAWSKLNVIHFGRQNLDFDKVLVRARIAWILFRASNEGDRPGVDLNAGQRAALFLEYRIHALGLQDADKSILHYGLLLKSTARGQLDCSDPRDYIYRMNVIMAEAVPDQPPPPAYSKSWPEVYKDFAVWALAREKAFLTLSLSSEPAPELPSWVPNYSKCDESGVLFRPSKPFLFAGRDGTIETTFSEDKAIMTVRGKIVDEIASYCPAVLDIPLPDPDKEGGLPVNRPTVDRVSSDPLHLDVEVSTSFAQSMVRLRRWLDACVAQAAKGHESQDSFLNMTEERFDQFWKTLALSYITDESATRTDDEYRALFRGYLSFWKVGTPGPVDISMFADEEYLEEWVKEGAADLTLTENALYYAPTVRFAVTKEGRLALAPKRAEVGDLVCVIPGAQTAHVIRRQDNGRYRLVGDCYVHGLMDGEAMEMEDVPLENIELE